MTAGLLLTGLHAGYGEAEVLHDVTWQVDAGSLTVLTGPNGAGKTTLLAAVTGSVAATGGSIVVGTTPLQGTSMRDRRRAGVSYVPEGRDLFPSLTVWENLRVAARAWEIPAREVPERIDQALAPFPQIEARRSTPVARLSGGQQQLVCIVRALLTEPRLLLLDEPSTGLSPIVWKEVIGQCRRLTTLGCTVVMVEQRLLDVVEEVDRYAILRGGAIVREGDGGQEMRRDPQLQADYFAVGEAT